MREIVSCVFPDMKPDARKKSWKELDRRANDFSREDTGEVITLDQIARRMAGKLGNG